MAGLKTILCIEDDHFISELYVRSLVRAGFDVDTTLSGKEGMDMALAKEYDIILLDIMTPDMTGIEVLKAVRGKENLLPNTRILITTNLDLEENSRADLEKMADGYLIKAEITPSHLVKILKGLK